MKAGNLACLSSKSVAAYRLAVAQHIPEFSAVINHGAVSSGLHVEDFPATVTQVEAEIKLGRDAGRLHYPGAYMDIVYALSPRGKIAYGLICVTGQFLDQCCHE